MSKQNSLFEATFLRGKQLLQQGKAMLILIAAFLMVTSSAVAQTDATATGTTYTTSFSAPTKLTIENQSILPNSQPTVLFKFTRTMTETAASIAGTYTAADPAAVPPVTGVPFAANVGAVATAYPRITNESSLTYSSMNGTDWIIDQTIIYGNDIQLVVSLNTENPDSRQKAALIQNVILYQSYDETTFSHEQVGVAGGIALLSSQAGGGNTSWNFPISDIIFTEGVNETTTFWIAVQTASVPGKTLDEKKTFGILTGSEDTRAVLEFNANLGSYAPSAATPTGSANATDPDGENGRTADLLTCEAHVVDLLAYPTDSSDYYTSFGITIGPGNDGFPPASHDDYLNSLVKYFTVNAMEFYKPTGNQVTDGQSALAAIGEAQRELMGLNTPFAVLGLNVASLRGDENSTAERLKKINVTITKPANSSFNPSTDLANDLQAPYPNISLWRDSNGNGKYDDGDLMVALKYDNMSGEVNHSKWTGSGSYTAILTVPDTGVELDTTADDKVDFFICLTANPSSSAVTEQPKYGAEFQMQVTDLTFYYQNDEDPDGIDLTPGSISDTHALAENFDDITSRRVKIGLEMIPHVPDALEADGLPVPVLSLNMADSRASEINETLHSIKVRFTNNDFTPNKLAALSDDAFSGVSLWKDNKAGVSRFVGTFDPRSGFDASNPMLGQSNPDTCVSLSTDDLVWYYYNGTNSVRWDGTQSVTSEPTDYFFVVLKPKNPIELYDHDLFFDPANPSNKGEFRGMDYFICVRGGGVGRSYSGTDRGLDYGDSITATVKPYGDLLFGYGNNAVEATMEFDSYNTNNTSITQTVIAKMPTFFSEPVNDSGSYLAANRKTAVLAIDIVAPAASTESFSHLAFQVIDSGNTFTLSDLVEPDSSGADCGIAIYKDNGDGIFNDETDTRVSTSSDQLPTISTMTWNDGKIHMIELNLVACAIPQTNSGNDAGPDYFLVLQPTSSADPGEQFSIQLWGSDLLGSRDDTISTTTDSPYTYKRFRSSSDYTVESVTNDILTNFVNVGQQLLPTGSNSKLDAIGLNVNYPESLQERNKLQRLRVYFDAQDSLKPDWLLNPLDGTINAGLQLKDAAGTIIATNATTWKSDYDNSYVAYNTIVN
ncbi:MAG: hypothetical protein WCT05_14085, partial [Lentisphaeria bacterium]